MPANALFLAGKGIENTDMARDKPYLNTCADAVTDSGGRAQAEEALYSSERRFQDIARASADWVWEVDEAGRYTFASDSVQNLLGYSAIEMIGKTPFEFMSAAEAERVGVKFAALVARGEPFRDLDNTVRHKDGSLRHLETNGVPILRADGKLLGYRGLDRDVTERKQMELELAQYRQHLEELVSLRTAELDTANHRLGTLAATLEEQVISRTNQLEVVSAQLLKTEERERRMLAEELHDNLGQLLAAIKIKLTALVAGPLESSVAPIVALVDQADRSARAITQQLSPTLLRTLGLQPALKWLAGEMKRGYGLSVHVDTDGETPAGFPIELQAVLFRSARELLINVARHAKVNDARLSCLCEQGRVTLAVSDAGGGFNWRNVLPELGGFGLSSIRERIVSLGGDMDIDSSPGQGATIVVSVPYAVEATGSPAS